MTKEKNKNIASYILGLLACVAFFLGFIQALSEKRSRYELKEKAQQRYDYSVHIAYLDSMNIERLEQRAHDSIQLLRNDKWEQLQIKHNVIPNKK